MNKGRCVRCVCAKAGRRCVDCWPSISSPARCENLCPPSVDTNYSSGDPNSIQSEVNPLANARSQREEPRYMWSDFFGKHNNTTKILRRIPRLSRDVCARKLASIISEVVSTNSESSWSRLMLFPRRCLRAPKRGGRHRNLSSLVNQQVADEQDPPTAIADSKKTKKSTSDVSDLARRVSIKLEEGDIKGAVRLASSEDSIAGESNSTIAALVSRHPPSHPETVPVPPPDDKDLADALVVSEQFIRQVIRCFPNGSAGGPDGLRPQHLCDLTGTSAGKGGILLIQALTCFVNHVLAYGTPEHVKPFFFGASITALSKKNGGVRPIAVGCTLRRLVAKAASRALSDRMASLLSPVQLGFGVPHGAEAAVHATRIYLSNLPADHVLLKHFANAFNTIRRDKMLESVKEFAPEIFPFVHSCYSDTSFLRFGSTDLHSSEGIQQGDPLGPLLFCLTIHSLTALLKSELKIFYLDDGTIGGAESSVLADLKSIECNARHLGLHLNYNKTEIICSKESGTQLLSYAPGLRTVEPNDADLLGTPLGDMSCIDNVLSDKVNKLKILGDRLGHLYKQDALLLIRSAFSMPKILYLLRTAPCFSSPALDDFDKELRSILSTILNLSLDDENVWIQATLPINSGGLGVRRSVQLAPSAFLASATASAPLVTQLLPSRFVSLPYHPMERALSVWVQSANCPPPTTPSDCKQRAWDQPQVSSTFRKLLEVIDTDVGHARLLAANTKESGAWLHALPIASVGLRMEDDDVRIAAAIRLGAYLCHPHKCYHCGNDVDATAIHGLSCLKSAGRSYRHTAINTIIQKALSAGNIPSRLEPSGLYRSDGKRPDGITIAPWERGRTLIWDATCIDTFAPSYTRMAIEEAGSVAEIAEIRKKKNYEALSTVHIFTPIAVETSGVFGPETRCFLRKLASRMRSVTNDEKSLFHLTQQLAVTIQRGNALSILGTHVPYGTSVD